MNVNHEKIYTALADDQSKDIFEKRLLYSVTGDFRYIDELVTCEVKRYEKNDIIYRLIEWINGRDAVVFGAGFAGQQIVHMLKLNNITVKCILDNNFASWGNYIYDVQICNPEHFVYSEKNAVVIGTNFYREDIYQQLIKSGVLSGNIFKPNEAWWLGPYNQYFDSEIINLKSNTAFIDGGSLDGADSVRFAEYCQNQYSAIYAFEPDPENIKKLKRTGKLLHNVNVCEEGLWSEKGQLRFSSGKAQNSTISEEGDVVINVNSIDNILLKNVSPYIKMDIEGSEIMALKGAEKTILQYKPQMAICVYHKSGDIIEIPEFILALNPEYKLYLRHYSYLDTETVLYAI